MIRPQLLMSAQQTVAQAFVGEGITVRFDAKVPHADLLGRVMHLRPMPEEVSAVEMQDIRADCDHELAHFLYTDPAVLEEIKSPLVKTFTNSIEDGFIERRHGEKFFGCAENLAESNQRHFAELRERADDSAISRRARATTALMLLSNGHSEEQAYEWLGAGFEDYIDQIRDLIPEISAVNSTEDSLCLGRQIADIWRWDSLDDQKWEKLREKLEAGNIDALPDRNKKGEAKVAKMLEAEQITAARKRKISKMSFTRSKMYRAITDDDRISSVPEPTKTKWSLAETTPVFMHSVRQIAGPLRRRLLMEFRGPGKRIARHQKRGAIDQRSLHKVAIGDTRLFESEIPDIVIDRDVTLMVDCSGSMLGTSDYYPSTTHLDARQESRLWVATQAACACSLVLDLIGVPNEVLAWTTHGSARHVPGFERVTPLWHMVVKPANGSFHRYQNEFTKLALCDHPAQNIDGEAVLWGAMRLAYRARRASRRPLLIVFSDGEPLSNPEDPSVLSWHLKEAVYRIEQAGIPTIGVGIQTNSVKYYYPRWTVVEQLEDLVSKFYVLLRNELRKSKKITV